MEQATEVVGMSEQRIVPPDEAQRLAAHIYECGLSHLTREEAQSLAHTAAVLGEDRNRLLAEVNRLQEMDRSLREELYGGPDSTGGPEGWIGRAVEAEAKIEAMLPPGVYAVNEPIHLSRSLTRFLLERVAEDENYARAATDGGSADWTLRPAVCECCDEIVAGSAAIGGAIDDRSSPHIARWDPTRALRECEAKRAIVTEGGPAECGGHETDPENHYPAPSSYPCDGCASAESSDAGWRHTLRRLAGVYADHPDYQPEWALAELDALKEEA